MKKLLSLSFLLMLLFVPFFMVLPMRRGFSTKNDDFMDTSIHDYCNYCEDEGYVDLLDNNKFKCRNCEENYFRGSNGIEKERCLNLRKHIENCYGITIKERGKSFVAIAFSSNPPKKIKLTNRKFLRKGHHIGKLGVYNPKKKREEKKFKCAYCFKEDSWYRKKDHLVHYHNVDVEKKISDQDFSRLKNVDSKVSEKYQKNVHENMSLPMPSNQFPEFQNIAQNQPANDVKEKPAISNFFNPAAKALALKGVGNRKKKPKKNPKTIPEHLQAWKYVEVLNKEKFKCNKCEKTCKKPGTSQVTSHVEYCYGITPRKTREGMVPVSFSSTPPKDISMRNGGYLKKGHVTKEYYVFNSKKNRNEKRFQCAYCCKEYTVRSIKNHL
ncbi:hypothetical protein ACFLYA_02910, partial [Candidatus Dependentiae bacterium]